MTAMAIFMGLLPLMWGTGTGSETMKPIAAPMIGGVITSFVLTQLIYPCIYTIWKWNFEVKKHSPAKPSKP
jgi:Cu(I)/Ag(I) efflux system membrane protein CusA/SilA